MFEELLIKYVSPTLAGIKTGNLFKMYLSENINIDNILNHYNNLLNTFGVYLFNIYETNTYILIYAYRLSLLNKDLYRYEVINFLKSYGYNTFEINSLLFHLRNRFYIYGKTPHEVGLFLSYPLIDVKGFIINNGKNYKFQGCWKVYGDVDKCKILFDNYKKCKANNLRLYNMGFSLESLIFKEY